jgi:hypothetical protein
MFSTRLLFIVTLLFSIGSYAQLFTHSFDPVFQDKNGEVLELALTGGLNHPQFSNIDLNGDGDWDLLVYDRMGDKLLTFVSKKNGTTVDWKYEPAYEQFFPKGKEFYLLRDFNDDGKPDIWTYTGDSVVLYRNVSKSLPEFVEHKKLYAYDLVNYVPFNPYKKLTQVVGCIPGIEDLDYDGDIDFVTNLNSGGSSMILNCNTTVDSGHALNNISFSIPDKCYGGVDELGNELILNAFCYFREAYPPKKEKKKHEATKTILFFDNDDDGDMDMFYGSSEELNIPVYFLENGRTDLGNYYKDTFISMDTVYFEKEIRDKLAVAPGSFYLDINLDGTKDLIMASNERVIDSYPIMQTDNVTYFINKGKDSKPDFEYQTNKFLVGEMVDWGAHTAPALVDMDGDEDLDLVVATNGDHAKTANLNDYLVYYENIGSKSNPVFKQMDTDFAGVKQLGLQRIIPEFADLDKDGDYDLYLGNSEGTILEFVNNGTSSSPDFILNNNKFQNIDVGDASAPYFYDVDENGTIDLLCGTYRGPIHYYKNLSSAGAVMQLENDSFGNVLVNELIKQAILTADGFKDTLVYSFFAFSKPTIGSFKDGEKALLVGGNEGKLRVFGLDEDHTSTFKEMPDYMATHIGKDAFTQDWGENIYTAAGDLNNDGITDVIIGTNRGGITYMQGEDKALDLKSVSSSKFTTESFGLFPNPAQDAFYVVLTTNKTFTYQIIDLSGREIAQGEANNRTAIPLGKDIANGSYIVKVFTAEKVLTQRLMVSR